MSANVNQPAPAAPVAQPVTPPAAAAKPLSPNPGPVTPADAGASQGREAEYQAALAAARGEQTPELSDTAKRIKAEGDAAAAEAGDDGEDVVEGDDAGGETEEQTTHTPKLKKFKVNGKEIELDLGDETVVEQHVQKGLAAEEKFQFAAKIQRNAEAFLGSLRDNAIATLLNPKLGVDKATLRKQVERWLYEEVTFESASPDEQKRLTDVKELEARRASEESTKTRAAAKRRQDLKEKYQADMTKEFVDVLGTNDLPVTDYTVQRMAHYMRAALKNNMKHIRPKDVAPLVKRDWEKTFKQLTSHLDGEKLIQQFGEEAADKMRQARLAKSRGDASANPRPVANPAPRAVKRPTPTTTYNSAEEMRDAMVANSRRGG